METVRRAVAALTVPLVAASVLMPTTCAAHAGTAYAGTTHAGAAYVGTATAETMSLGADPSGPIGGPQLGARGLVLNRASGVPALPKIDASSFVIADADTGEVLAARNPHGHYLPASALKVLTAVTLIPKLDADALVRPSQSACDVEGTKVGMTPKLRYKVSDLFKALLMVSGNDAALALSQESGGTSRTLAAMNAEARRLQANDTRAGSANGLDVDLGLNIKTQHTSAYDLALMMKQGLKLPDFRTYVGTVNANWPAPATKAQRKKGKKIGGYPIYTHDRLIRPGPSRYRGMIGGKNGYTNAAMQTFVGAARRNGHTIIVSLMKSPTQFWPYLPKMLDWGFAATGKVRPAGTLVDPVDTRPTEKKDERPQVGPLSLPVAPADAAGRWRLLGAVGGGSVLLLGGTLVLLRRRRRGDGGQAHDAQPADLATATESGQTADSGHPS